MKEVHNNGKNNRRPMDNPDLVELGKNIQKQREFIGMSQEELGLEIGTAKGKISLYESAQMVMKVDRFFDIAEALLVTPTELAPERFNNQPNIDLKLFQIGEMIKKLNPEKQAAAYRAMEAIVIGFGSVE